MKIKKKIIASLAVTLFISIFSFVSAYAVEELSLKEGSWLSITGAGDTKYILGFSKEKKVSDLLLHFNDASDIKAYKNEVALNENHVVSTGTLITLGNDKAYVVIKGDTNGDGEISSTDYLQIKGYFIGTYHLDGVYFKAADTQNDGQITSTDYLQIKGYFLGTYNLYPEECKHSFGDWGIKESPTCTENGVKSRTCQKCSIEETAEVSPLGHTEVIDKAVAPTQTTTGLTEGKHCSVCKTVLKAQEIIPALPSENEIWSETLKVDGKTIKGVVSNSTEVFSFINDIHVENNLIWVLSIDIYGMSNIATKTAPLKEGENIFYIHITRADQSVSTYTVNIYRKHVYTVSFNTAGGTSAEIQYVEEGYFAYEPVTLRDGYTFNGWNFDFSNPITANTTITALWIANTNTPYKVEYYLQNIDKTDYTLLSSETENLTGTTDTTAKAEEKSFEHFTLDRSKSTLSGNISGKGTLILKVYYTRNTYSITSSDSTLCTVTNGGTYAYGKQITVNATVKKLGYRFVGWYSGEKLLSTSADYTFIVDKDVVAKVEVVDELKNSYFTSTSTTCKITGIKDKTVTSVVIPDFVTSIGDSAFKGCTSLQSITLPFVGDTKNGTSNTHFGYVFGASWYYYNDNYVPTSLKTVIITGGSSIGSYAFYNCASLASITISDSVTTIGEYAFSSCEGLLSITIPDSVTTIGEYAFSSCKGLLSITIPDSVTTIGEYAFYYCRSLTSIIIGKGVTSIGEYAFSSCEGLLSITIPDSVTTIGSFAFEDCTSLESITIPNSVTSIGRYAFYNCTSLTSITIPDSVTSIGNYAFRDCKGLLSITIPNSVTSIGSYAFYNCTRLVSITLPFVGATKDGTSNTHFGYIFGASSYSYNDDYVPTSLKTVIITGGSSIGYSAFSDCINLESITIPDSVTTIGKYAFYNCTRLESITLPFVGAAKDGTSNTHFGYIFGASSYSYNYDYVPTSLKTVIITGGSSIGDYAFYECTSLTSITIPDSVTSIGASEFKYCTSLSSINFTGTKSQWNAISKGSYWNSNTGSFVIYCTDGSITK